MRKRGQAIENIPPWVIMVLVLLLVALVYGILSGKLQIYLQYFKDILKLGK